LLPNRDWLGAPIPNPQYGNIIRKQQAIVDPIASEMETLQIHPGPPQDRVAGVKLTPRLFDEYQVTAGALTRQMLESMVESPGWQQLPDYVRETAIRHAVTAAREQGAAAMQMNHPEPITMGLQQRIAHITGAAHTRRPGCSEVDARFGPLESIGLHMDPVSRVELDVLKSCNLRSACGRGTFEISVAFPIQLARSKKPSNFNDLQTTSKLESPRSELVIDRADRRSRSSRSRRPCRAIRQRRIWPICPAHLICGGPPPR
jgi:hypothetical protein